MGGHREVAMQRAKALSRTCLFVVILALAAGGAVSRSARAQGYPYCPPGYYFDPTYGCVPLSYFYGPPTYVYPGFSFGFFYGGHWDHRRGGHPGGAPPHGGGAPHGGAAHGGRHH
jgi:hypothetical protein